MSARPERTSAAVLGRIRLRHLQCVLAVARSGTLRGAAQALSITQPAVTKTLNELEDLLGTTLFVRGRNGATLTAEAEAFVLHATASLAALGQAVDSVVGVPDEAPLRIGVLPTLTPSFMPAVLRAFAAGRPGARLRVTSGRNRELIGALRARELDLVVGRRSEADAMVGVTFEHLYAEPVVVVVRDGHPFVAQHARRKASLGELSGFPMVLPVTGTLIRQVADSFLARHGITPRAGLIESIETSLSRALVLGDNHVWLTPMDAAQPDLVAGTMKLLDAVLEPEEPVGLMLPTDTPPSPALQALMVAARDEAARRRASGRRHPVRSSARRRRSPPGP
jgi:LysR family pca operon transcriptional activator